MGQVFIDYAVQNFAMYFLIIAFFAIVISNRKNHFSNIRFIVLAICIAVVLSFTTAIEVWTSDYPDMVIARTILSFFGFCLRPAAILSLILVLETNKKRRIILLIPEILNVLAFIPCFFTDIVFVFDENYDFVRKPLGYFVFAVTIFYFAYFLFIVIRSHSMGRRREFSVLLVCTICSAIGIMLDVLFYGTSINISIIICCLFYYLFLNSDYAGRDTLTSLQTRNAFYADSVWHADTISAVAGLDINGLKEINDMQGHLAGDETLKNIGMVMNSHSSRYVSSYRIGGDEFAMIFRDMPETQVTEILADIRNRLNDIGINIAVGYGYKKEKDSSFENLFKLADDNMYVNKREFYESTVGDRRTRK